ncbi:MAG: hypothetical protein KME31_19035 [Tolypothrix carrinoi HA7290-LM1]|nr:hypothetical protein [Tolypothrix carrinoi HA7290-LM1]
MGKNYYQCPMPHAPCPMPHALCPMPNKSVQSQQSSKYSVLSMRSHSYLPLIS